MARKVAKNCWSHLPLGLLISFFAPPGDLHEVYQPHTTAPRISDTVTPDLRQDFSATVLHSPAAAWQPATRTDITTSTFNFDSNTLNQLIDHGQVTVDHPEGGDLVLSLVSTTEQAGIRTLAIRSDNYPGTITARGESFFATLATKRGVYAIEHRDGVSALVDQRQLDLRVTQPDYQHVPTA